jgi:hypothetical protein
MLAALLLFGALLGAFHHHTGAAAEDGCAVCTLAHTAVDTAPAVVAPTASVVVVGTAFVHRTLAPRSVVLTASSSRAPPQG